MLKVVICDDDKYICSDIEKMVLRYADEKNYFFETEVFYSGETLYNYLQQTEVDIVFLDIELIKMSGIEVGEEIRNTLFNDNIQIVYISAKENYALSLFESRPLDFLVKPILYSHIKHTLDKVIRISDKNNAYFEYKVGHDFFKVQYKDIIYFKSNDKKVIIVMNDKLKEFYGKLDLLNLPKDLFWRIHKSYIVNSKHISEYYYDCLLMSNGEIISISQTYRKTLRSKILLEWENYND